MANRSTRIDPMDSEGEVQLMNSETLQRTGSQMSLGAVFGYCAAKALQWLGNVAAIGVGGAFAAAQTASYFGYIDIRWEKAQDDFTAALDLDKDGTVTESDLSILMEGALKVLQYNLPAGTGFTSAFAYGLGMRPVTALSASAVYSATARFALPRISSLLATGGLSVAGPTAAIEMSQSSHEKKLQEWTHKEAETISSEVQEYRKQLQRMRSHEMDVEEAYLRGRLETPNNRPEKASLLRAKLQALTYERRNRTGSIWRNLF